MIMWKGYKNYDHYFTFDKYDEFIDEVGVSQLITSQKTTNSVEYINTPAAFDIETSSTYVNNEKFATMYIWQFGLDGSVIIGRTWLEFIDLLYKLQKDLDLWFKKRLIVYIHNFSFEFQFIRKWVEWEKDKDGNDIVFSVKNRKPLYALTTTGIEFRCSYLLSNYALVYIGAKLLRKYPVKKLVGDLDYSKLRHSKTELTPQEIEYCANDVRVVMSFIQEKIENEGAICNIPYTNTGYVREYCRAYCFGEFENTPEEATKRKFEYKTIMNGLKIQSTKEYTQLHKAFAGGFTHSNPNFFRVVAKDVGSIDFASSYPGVMCSEPGFPMSSGTYIGQLTEPQVGYPPKPDRLQILLDNFCCLFTCIFYNLFSTFCDQYISVSKCTDLSKDYVANNGRLVDADFCQITLTDVDFDIISKTYEWSRLEVIDMRCYKRGYLPRPFIMSILHLYKNKTSLKGVEGMETQYMVSKNMINSSYGMSVTSIVRDQITHNHEWMVEDGDDAEQIQHYNKSFKRFLFYPWGVWVTAFARHNLWEGLLEFGDDYVYADTDSIKAINMEKHENFIRDYNLKIRAKLYKMCNYYNISYTDVEPCTPDGARKLLGVWEREENYNYFKALGAKRYMYQYENGFINMTVSGVNKNVAMPYLLQEYLNIPKEIAEGAYTTDPSVSTKEGIKKLIKYIKDNNINLSPLFDAFDDTLSIPAGYSGKLTHTYIDDTEMYNITDYNGVKCFCIEKSGTHLEPAGYELSISSQYLDFLFGVVQHEC